MPFTSRRLAPAIVLLLVLAGCSALVTGQPSRDVTVASSSGSGSGAASSSESSSGAGSGSGDFPGTSVTQPPAGPRSTSGATAATGSSAVPSSAVPSSTVAAPRVDGAVGAIGIGDPYYPESGNGGYQVDSYDVDLTYDPAGNELQARTTVTGTVTAPGKLGRFDLDLQPSMVVTKVVVNGSPAAFTHQNAELVITPTVGLAPKSALTVLVSYGGQPGPILGGTANDGDGGWYRTIDGGALAIGEPYSASAWYPVNEHPADTAAFRVTATVPAKWKVISNGVQQTTDLPAPPAGSAVFRWQQRQPIASYLTTIYIGTFSTVEDHLADGRPIVSAFAPVPDAERYKKMAADTRKIIEDLVKHFGPYPFDAAGGIYTGEKISFALETATRPVYANWVNTETIIHELGHQWYGDDVAIERWADICLNECFASYAPWLYYADTEHRDLDAQWVAEMQVDVADPVFWTSPLVDMGAGQEFTAVYSRGPLALHALRKEIGEAKFAALLLDWPKQFGGQNVTFDMWEAYVNRLAGRDLTGFIDAWFRGKVVPPEKYLHPGGLGR